MNEEVGLFLIILFGIALYFLPFIVAKIKKSERSTQVFLLNFFLGWTFFVWVIAFVIAVGKNKKM